MKLYLHIGSDKCGSTAIQTSLYLNRDELIQQGIYIPTSGLSPNAGHAKCFEDETNTTFNQLIDELKTVESKFHSALISWEGIHFLRPEKLTQQFSQLSKFDATAIYYVRDQAEIIQTGILQQWKTSNCRIPFDILMPKTRFFFDVAELWTKFLGQQTLVINYDREAFTGGDIALDFYSRIGLCNARGIEPLNSVVNESLKYESGFLISKLDRLFPLNLNKRRSLVDALLSAQSQFNLSKFFFSEDDVNEVREHYQENNLALEDKYNLKPINSQSSCWRVGELPGTIHPELLTKTLEIFDSPIIANKSTDKLTRTPINALNSGWYPPGNWGAWTKGQTSVLSFRIMAAELGMRFAQRKGFQLEITGRYFGPSKPLSKIRLNDGPIHEANLSHFILPFKREEIPTNRCMKLVIENTGGVSPFDLGTGRDKRKLTFGIEGISLE